MLFEECQLLAISVLLPVCFILILNHRRESLIFGSEALQIACGAWAGAEGMGGLSLAFVPGIAVSFYLRREAAFRPLWASKDHLCESGQLQFLPAKIISPSESTGLKGCCAPLLKEGEVKVEY